MEWCKLFSNKVSRGLASCVLLLLCLCVSQVKASAQESTEPTTPVRGYMVPAEREGRDTIPHIRLRTLHVFAPLNFASEKERLDYLRLIRDVKKTLPFAKIIASTMKETFEYMETLPNDKERNKHLKRMEKELYKEYFPQMKQLTLRQGKLLIQLIDRQCGSSGFQLVEAFLGGFSANFWNIFAKVLGANLKADYDPKGKDALTERVVILVEYGMV